MSNIYERKIEERKKRKRNSKKSWKCIKPRGYCFEISDDKDYNPDIYKRLLYV